MDRTQITKLLYRNDSKLTELNYTRLNSGSEQELKRLIQALASNKSLSKLELSNACANGEDIGKDLVKALGKNNTLTYLDVSHNNLGDSVVKDIADILKVNTSLTYLDLSYNNLTKKSSSQLVNTISTKNISLLTLTLKEDTLNDLEFQSDVERLNNYLAENSQLKQALSGEGKAVQLRFRAIDRIPIILFRIHTLTHLDLSDNRINVSMQTVFTDADTYFYTNQPINNTSYYQAK